MTEKLHYLYHLRDPETSAGFGFDGYGGTTNDWRRRYREHMRACSIGRHPNPKVQQLYNDTDGNLQMRIVRVGTKEEVLASEALVFNRKDKHANIQPGGGYLRGLSEDELIRRSGLAKDHAESLKWQPPASNVSKQQMALIVAAGVAIAAGAYYDPGITKRGRVAPSLLPNTLTRIAELSRRVTRPSGRPKRQRDWQRRESCKRI